MPTPPVIDPHDTLAHVLDEAERRDRCLLTTLAVCIIAGCLIFACILVAIHYRLEQDRRALNAPMLKARAEAPYAR